MVDFTGGTWRSLIDGSEVSDIPDSVVDNFEDATATPLGVYEDGQEISDYYGGDTAAFSRDAGAAKEGDFGLRRSTSDTFTVITSNPGDGLNRYIKVGETWRCWVKVPSTESFTDSISVIFGHSSNTALDDGYLLMPREDSGKFLFLQRRDGGTVTDIASESISWPTNEWFEIEGHHEADGSFTGKIFDDQGSQIGSDLTANDSTYITDGEYDHEGIGYAAARIGDAGDWDELRIV